jgi:phenylalanyl-tRNA synthetase beta chain
MRFEKSVDIGNTVEVLKRAAKLIKEIAGGEISSNVIDIFPDPIAKNEVVLSRKYLKKLSGKNYDSDTVKNILHALDFEVVHEDVSDFKVSVPYSKPDISLPADLVEEIMRIDGYDSIEIPSSITITPSIETDAYKNAYKEKVSDYLVGLGFNEIFTNSITNSAYFNDADIRTCVKLLNNLSAIHNIMRPAMLETGLEAVAYNLNRKNADLKLFEFGKTYNSTEGGNYQETDYLCLYITGNKAPASWKNKSVAVDVYYLKGIVTKILQVAGLSEWSLSSTTDNKLEAAFQISIQNQPVITGGRVQKQELNRFDIKQAVFFASVDWRSVLNLLVSKKILFKELPRQLPVYRDLAMIVPKSLPYEAIENALYKIRLNKLREIKLFDIFENEKLGHEKKSLAINITFLDEEKTLTDVEIDHMMKKIMNALEKDLNAEIRK